MDERQMLIGRINRSVEDLNRARRGLDKMEADKFRERIEIRFKADFEKRLRQSLKLLDDVRMGLDLAECWRSAAAIDAELRPLLDEWVALLQGTMVRRAGLDDGICDIADALLEHLRALADAEWRRFTVPGSEYLTERTGIVRVRFPAASIWELPFVAHEFAHVIEPQIRSFDEDGTTFEVLTRLLTENAAGAQQRAFLREHFADVLATYAVGPMFGWAAIVLQFEPLSAFDPEGELDAHPSPAKRVHMILRTLEVMDDTQPGGEPLFGAARTRMKKLWEDTLTAVGTKTELPGPTISLLDRQQSDLFAIIDENLSSLRYTAWERARAIAERVAADESPSIPDSRMTVVDVLNAAWVSRLASPGIGVFELKRLEMKFEDICQMVTKER